jgi:hypothetical protein
MAAVGGVLTTSLISLAQPPPLPPRTPAQLLTALAANPSGPALSGTVVETASLGLPALPSIVGPISLSSFLAGSHVIKVWYADPTHYRIAVPQTDTESDLVRDGGVPAADPAAGGGPGAGHGRPDHDGQRGRQRDRGW